MSPVRSGLTVFGLLFGAIVLETTVFGRLNVGGAAPDMVMLVVILLPFRLKPETSLILAFSAGLAVDALSSSPLGLRAFTLTVVAFAAIKTRERADYSPLAAAVWVLILTFAGVVLLWLVGTLTSQLRFGGGEALRHIVLVPLLTFAVALALWPVLGRLIEPVRRTL
jgi:rod shape-determining protein MreD